MKYLQSKDFLNRQLYKKNFLKKIIYKNFFFYNLNFYWILKLNNLKLNSSITRINSLCFYTNKKSYFNKFYFSRFFLKKSLNLGLITNFKKSSW